MHYAWGGYDFIPQTLGIQNTERKPFAEYWLGVHPLAPGVVRNGNEKLLSEFISEHPDAILSSRVHEQFGTLPFLLKVQDVREVLSIQVHPNKTQAEIGFKKEDGESIPSNASNRNYKDENHKPEIAIAVNEFWLLHGFRSEADLQSILHKHDSFSPLLSKLSDEGIEGLYRFVMTMPQALADEILLPVVREEIEEVLKGYASKYDASFWIARYYNNEVPTENIDRGIFSMFLLNIVKLNPGESIFQDAGILHAYLEGYNVELMANSDNVLRGGLTPKHIDIPELLQQTAFKSVTPNITAGTKQGVETKYPVVVPDFGITKIDLESTDTYTNTSSSLEIHLVLKGEVSINNAGQTITFKNGESFGVAADTEYTLSTPSHCEVYRAFVP
jgi:mannose-6-phosphate isomerase